VGLPGGGVKRPEGGVEHPPHKVEVKESVELYIYSPPLVLRGLFYAEIYLYL